MAKYLVIVESPAKVKTIKKFLGKNYEVAASNGHVRDLPKSQMGIDIENDFEPKYITIRGKGDILAKLRKQVKNAEKIYLATDPDREGEAISWHLYHSLKLEGRQVYRISFNEITQSAVKASLKEARDIHMDLVDAQQARRILDRMVGYKISPLLWKKVKRGLSAGRVQSVALRIICDREEIIDAFIPREYWTVNVKLDIPGQKEPVQANLVSGKEAKSELSTKEEADKIKEIVENSPFIVESIKSGERIKNAPLPFITSSLQQEASKVLNFSTQKTMRIAQQLYEGIDLKGEGTVGLITYLRTDSTRISEEAIQLAQEYITEEYGPQYSSVFQQNKKNTGKVQDAHEAIRPSDIKRSPVMVKTSLSRDQFRLYQLIWKRFCASRMTQAKYDTFSVRLESGGYPFSIATSKLSFEGFLCVYTTDEDEKTESNSKLNSLKVKDELILNEVVNNQHYTQAPAHYTEATLVKMLEELGIGRPSTYSPTISTIIGRRYIAKEGKNLYVTELGEVVNKIMKDAFPDIVNEQFTANMELQLDKVAEGNMEWKEIVREFYPHLDAEVTRAEEELEKIEISDEISDEICDVCGKNMVVKYGPHGKFLACPGFPECRNTKTYFEKTGVDCPKCGKQIVIKKTKKGRRYYGCENNPECDFMSWQKVSKEKCPNCGGYMLEKGTKLVCADEQCGYVSQEKR